jgi:hypothetical protein
MLFEFKTNVNLKKVCGIYFRLPENFLFGFFLLSAFSSFEVRITIMFLSESTF